jgi:hypothetical protein
MLRNTGMPLFEYCSNEASRVPLASALCSSLIAWA